MQFAPGLRLVTATPLAIQADTLKLASEQHAVMELPMRMVPKSRRAVPLLDTVTFCAGDWMPETTVPKSTLVGDAES